MAIDSTSMMEEVWSIIGNGGQAVSSYWTAEITVNDGKSDTVIPALAVTSIDVVRDYVNNYGDEIFVEVLLGPGTFSHDIYPYKNNLTMTLYRHPNGEVSTATDLTKDIESQVMRATLVDDMSAVVAGVIQHMQDKKAADISDLLYVKFQLVDLTLEQVRMQTVGGVFRKTTSADALTYILTEVSSQVAVDDEHRVQGVDIYPPSNTEPQDHIVIPHGSRFPDVPGYINDECAALYNAGFGFYIQKRHWYVYPLFDLTRFDKDLKTLTLFNVPKNRFPQIERTFRRTANQVLAIVTGDVLHKDDSESKQLNEGNGVRYADARKVFDSFALTENNKTTIQRAQNNSEFLTESRPNGLNNVQLSPRPITSNTFRELSAMTRRSGAFISCVWENSDPGAIFPGMPVKYLYLVGNDVIETVGVVVQAHHFIGTSSPGITNRRHICNSALTLFVSKQIQWPSTSTQPS